MAKVQSIHKSDEGQKEAISLGDRALDNLKFIRETMEGSTHFTAVPGYGGVLMGVTAMVAAYIANGQLFVSDWLKVWLIEAFLAFAIGFLAMWQKSKISGVSMNSTPAKKFAKNFLPPLVCGIAITFGLWRFGHFEMMIPVWMLCYGAAVAAGGAFSVKAVPVMGWSFIALGALGFVLPAGYGNLMMGLSFGVLHVVFGFIIARRYGG